MTSKRQIHNARIKLLDDASGASNMLCSLAVASPSEPYEVLTADYRKTHISVQYMGKDLAVLESAVSDPLIEIRKRATTKVELLIDMGNLRKVGRLPKSSKKSKRDTTFHVNIVLYGVREESKTVGDILSRSRLYLQKPCHNSVSEYDNPHIIRFLDGDLDGKISTKTIQKSRAGLDLEVLLNGLGHESELEVPAPVDLILTKLKRYKDSLDFETSRLLIIIK